jgi:gas vesicle protein
MLDINGDLSEAIDNLVNEQEQGTMISPATGARFVGGLRGRTPTATGQQRAALAANLKDVFEDDVAEEIFGLIRLSVVGTQLGGDVARRLSPAFYGTIFQELLSTVDLNLQTGEIEIEKPEELQNYLKDKTEDVLKIIKTGKTYKKAAKAVAPGTRPRTIDDLEDKNRIRDRLGLPPIQTKDILSYLSAKGKELSKDMAKNYTRYKTLEEGLLPSELRRKDRVAYDIVSGYLRKNLDKVNKGVQKVMDQFIEEYNKKIEGLFDELEAVTAPDEEADITEGKLVQTIVDFDELRSQKVNEIFLKQLGGVIELVLGAMFDNRPLPIAFRGRDKDMARFADAIGGEKKYIEAARQYGLDHPTTYKSKAKLNNAIRKFEKDTGIKWPFK